MARESRLTRKSLTAGMTFIGLLAACSTGCVSVPQPRDCSKPVADAGKQQPANVVTRWQNDVGYAADPTRGGAQIPGIVGRVYVFGPQMDYPLEGDGSLHVELFDAAKPDKPLETWDIDPVAARKMQKQDAIGSGYSVFLPWSSYRKDLTQVQMRVSYKPAKSTTALFARTAVVHFGGPAPLVASSAYTTGPGGTKVTQPQRIQTAPTPMTRVP